MAQTELTEKGLREAFRRLTARPGHDRSPCPTPEFLVELVLTDPEPATPSRALEHLLYCSDCAREWQVVRSLADTTSGMATDLVSRRKRANAAPPPGEPAPTSWGEPPRSPWQGLSTPLKAVAAALILVCLITTISTLTFYLQKRRLGQELANAAQAQDQASTMGRTLDDAQAGLARLEAQRKDQELTIAELRRQIGELSTPFANHPIVELNLARAQRQGDVLARQVVTLPAGAPWFTLVVTLSRRVDHPDFAVEVIDSRTNTIWNESGLLRQGRGTFTLTFPTDLVGQGIYHLRFFGIGGDGSDGGSGAGTRELLEQFSIEVRTGP